MVGSVRLHTSHFWARNGAHTIRSSLVVSQPITQWQFFVLAGTHRGWNKERLDLIGKRVSEGSRLKTESCDKQKDICEEQNDVEEKKYETDNSKPTGFEGN